MPCKNCRRHKKYIFELEELLAEKDAELDRLDPQRHYYEALIDKYANDNCLNDEDAA